MKPERETANRPGDRGLALQEAVAGIAPPDEGARRLARARWDSVAKPLGSLGVLEDDIVRIAALTGSPDVSVGRRAVVVFCADNGVVEEGVAQCGQDVTSAVAANIARGASSVCKMAKAVGADVFGVDVGMVTPVADARIWDRSVARGTANMTRGPAMTRDQALRAIGVGIGVAGELAALGYDIIAAGEMGIGNTTTASALTAALLGLPVQSVTGRGAGLSDEGLRRKRAAIDRALAVNAPDPADALGALAALGGFDIAALCGLFIGGALRRVPVVVDGFISAIAAYTAGLLAPACTCALLASHVSAEPAARLLLERLGLRPAIAADLRLGEGTGAVCLFPLLDAACALYDGATFAETGIDPYERLS